MNTPTQSIQSQPSSTEEDGQNNNNFTPKQPRFFDGLTFVYAETVFIGQMLTVFAVVSVALYNLTTTDGAPQPLWIALLGSCLGYVLPNPKPKRWRRPLFT